MAGEPAVSAMFTTPFELTENKPDLGLRWILS